MSKIVDALITMRADGLRGVAISGGEPLIVIRLLEHLNRLVASGLEVYLTTTGQFLTAELAEQMGNMNVQVSIDSPDPATNDRIRGRAGAFATAIQALEVLDGVSRSRSERGTTPLDFGISTVVLRSTFDGLPRMLEIAARFEYLRMVGFDAAVPNGSASRASFESELLTNEELQLLVSAEFRQKLARLVRPSVSVLTSDNLSYQNHPSRADHPDLMTIEPDGEVRAMPNYGGTVGNILEDSPRELWARSLARRNDPFVVERLTNVASGAGWAAASRDITEHFASPAEVIRLRARPPYDRAAIFPG